MVKVQPSRTGRFWLIGFGLIATNAAIPAYRWFTHDAPNTIDLGFHAIMIFIGLALIDGSKAKEVANDIRDLIPFLRKSGDA